MKKNRQQNLDLQKELLTVKREELLKEIDKRLKKDETDDIPQLSDPADIASQSLQDELSMMVAGEEAKSIKQIDDALDRIDAGNYGLCVNCGCDINFERLKAIPFATQCVGCKEKEENDMIPDGEGFSYIRETESDYDTETDELDKKEEGNKDI